MRKVKLDHGLPRGEHIEKYAGFNHGVFHPQKNRSSPSRQSIRFQLEGVRRRVFFPGFAEVHVLNINQKNRWIIYTFHVKATSKPVMFYKHRAQKGEQTASKPWNCVAGNCWLPQLEGQLRLRRVLTTRAGETDVHGRQISWSNFHWPYLSGHKIFIIIAIIILITTRSTVITATFTTLPRSRLLRASPEAFPGRLFRSAESNKKRTFHQGSMENERISPEIHHY